MTNTKQEKALGTQVNQLLLQTVFDRMGEGVLVIDGKQKVVEANPYFLKLTGYTYQEVQELNQTDVLHLQPAKEKEIQTENLLALLYCKDQQQKTVQVTIQTIDQQMTIYFIKPLPPDAYNEHELLFEKEVLTEYTLSGLDIISNEGKFLYVNRAYLKMWGYDSADEVIGTSPVPHCLDPEIPKQIIQNLQHKQEYTLDFTARRKDGSTFEVHMLTKRFVGDDGNEFYIGSATDISDYQHTVTALAESEQRFRMTFELAAVGIARISLEGKWMECNQQVYKMLGYSQEELYKMTFQDVTYPEDLDSDLKLTRQLVNNEIEQYSLEKRYLRKDNRVIWAKLSVTLLRDEQQQPLYFISILEDITERKKTELALQESKQQVERVVQATNDAVWDWNVQTGYVWWNEGIASLFGYAEDQVEPNLEWWQSKVHPGDRERVTEGFQRVIQYKHHKWQTEYRFQKADGTYAWVIDRSFAEFEDQGKVIRMSGGMSDITQSKKAEQVLRKSEERLQKILHNLTEGLIIANLDGQMLYWNRAAIEIHGYNEDERPFKLLNNYQEVFQMFYPNGIEIPHDDWPTQRLIRKKPVRDLEIEMHRKDTNWARVFLYNGVQITDTSGQEIIFLTILDITDRKKHEEAITRLNQQLEERVAERTRQLADANQDLHAFAEEMQATNEELQTANEHSTTINDELTYTTQILQETQSIVHLGHWEVDLDDPTFTIACSPELYRIFNAPDDVVPTIGYLKQFIFRQDFDVLKGLIKNLLKTGEPYSLVYRIQHPQTGKIRYHFTKGFPVFGQKNRIIKIWGIAQDITEQEMINEELMTTTDILKESQARARLGHWEIVFHEHKPSRIFWSEELYRIFGIALNTPITDDLLKQYYFRDDFDRMLKNRMLEVHNQLNQKYETYEDTYQIQRSDGRVIFLETKGFPITDENGHLIKIRGISQDVTRRKQMEERLQETNALLEQKVKQRTAELQQTADTLQQRNEDLIRTNTDLDNFVYMSSHDLKHPITNLEGLMSVLHHYQSNIDQEMLEWVSMMNDSIHQLRNTIMHITEISKIQKGIEEKLEILQFSEVTEKVKKEVKGLIKINQAAIHTDFQVGELKYVPKYLHSIIQNLLSNAIKYRHPNRPAEVFLRTYAEKEYIVLAVQDNGLGLTESDQKKLFKMFKRLHVHVGGTGIGLYMIKRMIENYGGYITVESQYDQGTTFKVYFNTKHHTNTIQVS